MGHILLTSLIMLEGVFIELVLVCFDDRSILPANPSPRFRALNYSGVMGVILLHPLDRQDVP